MGGHTGGLMIATTIIAKTVITTIDAILLLITLYTLNKENKESTLGSELFAAILTAFNIMAIWI